MLIYGFAMKGVVFLAHGLALTLDCLATCAAWLYGWQWKYIELTSVELITMKSDHQYLHKSASQSNIPIQSS